MMATKPPAHARRAALKRRTIPAQGGKPAIHFAEGGLHRAMGVKPGTKMTAAQHAAAARSSNPRTRRQEQFYRNVLKRGR